MAATFISTATVRSASVTSQLVTLPTNVANDLITITISWGSDPGAIGGLPAGWAAIPGSGAAVSGAAFANTYYKVSNGAEANPTFSWATARNVRATTLVYRLADSVNPIATSSGQATASSATVTAPNFTNSTRGMLVWVGCWPSTATVTTAPSGFTSRQVDSSNAPSVWAGELSYSGHDTGDVTATLSATPSNTGTMFLIDDKGTASTSLGGDIYKSLTKTTSLGAKLWKTRSTNLGADIVESRGGYRGVMSETERDALAKKYTRDTVIATDNTNDAHAQYYTGSAWLTGARQQTSEGGASRYLVAAASSGGWRLELGDDTYQIRIWDGSTTMFSWDVTNGFSTRTLQMHASASVPFTEHYNDGAGSSAAARFGKGVDTGVNIGLEFGSGAAACDTNLYRSAANVLTTDDQFQATDGITSRLTSAAGKTTASDADFTVTPANGTIYVIRNTTTGDVRLAARAAGAWKVSAIMT